MNRLSVEISREQYPVILHRDLLYVKPFEDFFRPAYSGTVLEGLSSQLIKRKRAVDMGATL